MLSVSRVALRRCFSAHAASYPSRTHNCGALRAEHADVPVVLAGWLLPQRKISNALSFFSLRDAVGATQLVANRNSDHSARTLDALAAVPVESVVLVEGSVRLRPQTARRSSDPTGDVEVLIHDFTLLNPASHALMPFLPSDPSNIPNEELRSRFRHLDFRRSGSRLSSNLRKRSEVAHVVRNYLHEEDFVEVETPLLLKSTPEGAREFVVPTRVGQTSAAASSQLFPQDTSKRPSNESTAPSPLFYTLPQSPQQPKQLLVASGAVERYYQLARCFRDEDGRKDRQPEFTQIDLEMAFVDWGENPSTGASHPIDEWRIGGREVRRVTEELVRRVWRKAEHVELPSSFPVMIYNEVMSKFGSDKPDTRFGLHIHNFAEHVSQHAREKLANGNELVEYLLVRAPVKSVPGENFLEASYQMSIDLGEGVERFIMHNKDATLSWVQESAAIRDIDATDAQPGPSSGLDVGELNRKLGISVGDTLFVARRHIVSGGGSTALGRVRTRITEKATELGTYTPCPTPHFLWVTEFPLFTPASADPENQRSILDSGDDKRILWCSTHHPFTAPMSEDIEALMQGEFEKVRGQHYDLVLNGVEVGGGSVRVHDADMQEYIFEKVLKLSDSEKASFDHLLHALRCGAPPHGGIALGFDRLVAILCGTNSIRDVIAFPKTGGGLDPLFKSPSNVPDGVLAQYGIRAR